MRSQSADSATRGDVLGNAPFAPSTPLAGSLSADLFAQFGAYQRAKPSEELCVAGHLSRDIYFVPPSGVTIELRIDLGDADGAAHLATLRHGCVLGVEGALLGVRAPFSARVVASDRGASILVLGGAGIAKLRATHPPLLQKLLAAALAQQQDATAILARRTLLWRGGGWRGPNSTPALSSPRARRGDGGGASRARGRGEVAPAELALRGARGARPQPVGGRAAAVCAP